MARIINSALIFIAITISKNLLAYPTPVDFNGMISRWDITINNPVITYEILVEDNNSTGYLDTAIEEAALLWSDVTTSYLVFEQVNPGANAHISINIVETTGDVYSSGSAVFDEFDEKGPLHCDIIVSSQISYKGFAKTVLHELGHCIGLGHSLIPEAIMSYQLDKNNFNLDLDDAAGISRLYPSDGTEPKLPLGCSVFSKKSGATLWILLLPLLSLYSNRWPKCRML